ncbi:hypothetical protein Tco_0969856 [Tanacetum coccineum]
MQVFLATDNDATPIIPLYIFFFNKRSCKRWSKRVLDLGGNNGSADSSLPPSNWSLRRRKKCVRNLGTRFHHMASVGVQAASQGCSLNSLSIHGTGWENSVGIENPDETLQDVEYRSECQGAAGSRGEQMLLLQLIEAQTSVQASGVEYASNHEMCGQYSSCVPIAECVDNTSVAQARDTLINECLQEQSPLPSLVIGSVAVRNACANLKTCVKLLLRAVGDEKGHPNEIGQAPRCSLSLMHEIFCLMTKSDLYRPKERGGKVFVSPDSNQPMEHQVAIVTMRTVVGMILPMVWHKYDYKIREHGKRLQKQSNGFYTMIDARAVQKIKNKLNVKSPRVKIKEKKAE